VYNLYTIILFVKEDKQFSDIFNRY